MSRTKSTDPSKATTIPMVFDYEQATREWHEQLRAQRESNADSERTTRSYPAGT